MPVAYAVELKGRPNYKIKSLRFFADLKSGLLTCFKHCSGLLRKVWHWERKSGKKGKYQKPVNFWPGWQPHLSVLIVGILSPYLHSTAWIGLTVKDQYGLDHFRSFRMDVRVCHRIFDTGHLSFTGRAVWEMLGKIRVCPHLQAPLLYNVAYHKTTSCVLLIVGYMSICVHFSTKHKTHLMIMSIGLYGADPVHISFRSKENLSIALMGLSTVENCNGILPLQSLLCPIQLLIINF